VLDAAHAPGVSALNPSGWTVREAEAWALVCGADKRVRCFDLMELNPAHDPDGRFNAWTVTWLGLSKRSRVQIDGLRRLSPICGPAS